jgi:8-oxo-dGTP pyrophosphatase MutT (NUDIX family)
MANKHSHHEKRVAVIPILMKKTRPKIYLVTSREQGQWIIPTGKTEKRLSNRQVAVLEAFEEAGILGKLDKQFREQVLLQSPGGKYWRQTTVFLLYVKRKLKRWPEIDERKRKLIPVKDYVKTVLNKKLRRKLMDI